MGFRDYAQALWNVCVIAVLMSAYVLALTGLTILHWGSLVARRLISDFNSARKQIVSYYGK